MPDIMYLNDNLIEWLRGKMCQVTVCHIIRGRHINSSFGKLKSATSHLGHWLLFIYSQWFQSLFRCRNELLNFSMGFNIIAHYMEILHINRSLHQCNQSWHLSPLSYSIKNFIKIKPYLWQHILRVASIAIIIPRTAIPTNISSKTTNQSINLNLLHHVIHITKLLNVPGR